MARPKGATASSQKSTKKGQAASAAPSRTPQNAAAAARELLPPEEEIEEKSWPYLISMWIKSFATLACLPLVSIAIQMCLQPLYGTAPVLLHFRNIGLGAAILAGALPEPGSSRIFPNENAATGLLGLWLLAAPKLLHFVGAYTATWGEVVWGPVATHALVSLPALSLLTVVLRYYLIQSVSKPPPFIMAAPLLGWNFAQGIEPAMWGWLPSGDPWNGQNILKAVGTLAILASLLTPFPEPSPKRREPLLGKSSMTALGVLTVALASYSSFTPRRFPITSADGKIRLLASENGQLGLVAVGENGYQGYRYLRASHSLLGGVWIGEKAAIPQNDANPPSLLQPAKLGDSVYTAFILQEGVRLFEKPKSATKSGASQERALIIGLGAGIAPRAMNEHGVLVDIVEIDPLVYKYANEYFGLHRLRLEENGPGVGQDGGIWLEDARGWVHRYSGNASPPQYNYIVHDVFSGGSVAGHLFSVEFWDELKKLLRADGVLAVNFAGLLGTPASRAILTTLLHVFSDCKAYHDTMDAEFGTPEEHEDFLNMVFFCSQSSLITRKPQTSDYLDSPLRRHVLSQFPHRELPKAIIQGNMSSATGEDWIIRDASNRLAEWQQKSTLDHWRVMRGVLPDAAWELY